MTVYSSWLQGGQWGAMSAVCKYFQVNGSDKNKVECKLFTALSRKEAQYLPLTLQVNLSTRFWDQRVLECAQLLLEKSGMGAPLENSSQSISSPPKYWPHQVRRGDGGCSIWATVCAFSGVTMGWHQVNSWVTKPGNSIRVQGRPAFTLLWRG